MYRIAIVRKGQPADRRTCDGRGQLRDIVGEVIRADMDAAADHANTDRPATPDDRHLVRLALDAITT